MPNFFYGTVGSNSLTARRGWIVRLSWHRLWPAETSEHAVINTALGDTENLANLFGSSFFARLKCCSPELNWPHIGGANKSRLGMSLWGIS